MEGKLKIIRICDICLSTILIVLLFPIFSLVLFLKLIVDSRPLFYSSFRVGLKGQSFKVYKLRTMVNNPALIKNYIDRQHPSGGFQRLDIKAPIYTNFGFFCELFQFVELPQLINVLLGQMSLIGNRPLPKDITKALERDFGEDLVRSRVSCMPGISGIVQITGKNILTDKERLILEKGYCKFVLNASPFLVTLVYFLILLETLVQVISLGKIEIFKKQIQSIVCKK